jgi:hypothetical protein
MGIKESEKYDGTNWFTWEPLMIGYLKEKDLWEITQMDSKENKKLFEDENWAKKNRKAVGVIWRSIKPEMTEVIRDLDNADLCWKALEQTQIIESQTTMARYRYEFGNLRKSSGETMLSFLNKIDKYRRLLSNSSAPLQDAEVISHVERVLDYRTYEPIFRSLRATGKGDSYGHIKEALLNDAASLGLRDGSTFDKDYRGSAFNVGRPKGKCFSCGKVGHFKRDCWKKTGKSKYSNKQSK